MPTTLVELQLVETTHTISKEKKQMYVLDAVKYLSSLLTVDSITLM